MYSSATSRARRASITCPLARIDGTPHRSRSARLFIADLAEQFGAALEAALAQRRAPLTRLGDWLVMAAHLALLRSRLLPADTGEGREAQREAQALRRRLADREHARRLAEWLERRPRLGRDVFARGAAEGPENVDRVAPVAGTAVLFRACLAALEKDRAAGPYRPAPLPLWRVPDALARLRRMLPAAPPGGGRAAGALPAGSNRRWARRGFAGPGGAGQHAPRRPGAGEGRDLGARARGGVRTHLRRAGGGRSNRGGGGALTGADRA